jgi:hypothetical protein
MFSFWYLPCLISQTGQAQSLRLVLSGLNHRSWLRVIIASLRSRNLRAIYNSKHETRPSASFPPAPPLPITEAIQYP